jgi:hypothetical protein
MSMSDEIQRLTALAAWARTNGVLSLSLPDGMSLTLDPDWRPQTYEPSGPDEPQRRETPEEQREREQREDDELLFYSAS